MGNIIPVGFNFAPKYFAFCNGQILSIQQNQALFSLLGTTYGGNGTTVFQLPNLQGRTPLCTGVSPSSGQPWQIGQVGGVEQVTLTTNNLPAHNHIVMGTNVAATSRNPALGVPGNTGSENVYADATGPQVSLNAAEIAPVGGNAPHENMQPYLVVNFCIALQGLFPSRS